jgi:hypothetical protein
MSRSTKWGTVGLAAALAMTGRGCDCDPHIAPTPATFPTSMPTSLPTSVPSNVVARVVVPETLLDVVRVNDPTFPTTQPRETSFDLSAAARLRLDEPVYLCRRGDLWITHASARPTGQVLADAGKSQTHVTQEQVKFVYWRPDTQPWSAELIAFDTTASADAGAKSADVWITVTARLPLNRGLARDWSRAGLWNTDTMRAVVVPTQTGMSVLQVRDGQIDEQHVELAQQPAPGLIMSYALDPRGLLAWSSGPTESSNVARYVDGKWTLLTPDPAWPDRIAHLVPLLDGTVLAVAQEAASLKLRSISLETIAVDEARVLKWVKQLANPLPEEREAAQAQLAALGPGAWPVLRRLAPTQPAEARIRIRAILGNETTPTLSGITPEPGPGYLVCRLPDGGVVLNFSAGASAVTGNGVVAPFKPAVLSVRPDEGARRLPDSLVETLTPTNNSLVAWSDEWILEHDVDGPLRWLGNHTEPLLKKKEAVDFKKFIGIDSAGRWIYKSRDPNGPTLIVDPTLPDPKPRLPVWTVEVRNGAVGWNDKDYPVMKRGSAYYLRDGSWAGMTPQEADTLFRTALPAPTTAPTTVPTVLLVDKEGNTFTDGLETLNVVRKDGSRHVWPLPPEAVGSGAIDSAAVLMEADGKLFLANQPGRLLRISLDWNNPEPLKLEAVFTRHIPATDVRRIWKDPVGRIIYASGGFRLSVCFPEGRISKSMSNMIPAGALREALADESDAEALVAPNPAPKP